MDRQNFNKEQNKIVKLLRGEIERLNNKVSEQRKELSQRKKIINRQRNKIKELEERK